MKIKVLLSKKQTKEGRTFVSYFTPCNIVVKGEESKGPQAKGITVKFSKESEKKLPVDFKGGIITCDAKSVYAPYVYEVKTNAEGKKEYPFVYIKDLVSVDSLPVKVQNTCTFITDEEETKETNLPF